MEELIARFEALTEKEKMQFMKAIMPEMCQLFKANSKEMMQDMMPYCADMMQDCNMDMPQMMTMMSMMKK